MVQRFDVVIVGAGSAGCAAAIALLRHDPQLAVLLLERANGATPPFRFRIGETLPPQAAVLLQQLGLLQSFQARGDMAALGTRSVWGETQVNENPFMYSFYGHGWHIDRVSFDGWLLHQAENAGAAVLKGAAITGTAEYAQDWRLTIHQGTTQSMTIKTPVVVDASGRSAAFCRKLGIRVEKLDKLIGVFRFYQADGHEQEAGISDAVNIDDDHCSINHGIDSFTLVESCAYGWWYSSHLPHQLRVVALMTDSDLARSSGLLNESGWHNALHSTRHTQQRLTNVKPLTSLQTKPAHSQRLEQFCDHGWYAAGDAASTLDPLSSLGIFKALRHGLLASYAIRDDLQGKPETLQKYQYVLHSEFKHYLQTHQQYYQLENRFTDAPFWQRRQQ